MPLQRLAIVLAVASSASVNLVVAETDEVSFARDVRPLLSDRCYKCHGPGTQEADLRLDSRDAALAVIDLVSPDESELLRRITSDDEYEVMPPHEGGTRALSPDEIETLRLWIAAGAPFERHWAYEVPDRPHVPEGVHAVDHFIRAELATRGLKPSSPAEAAVLLRRLSLDLIGLPPTVAEVDAFVSNPTDKVYAAAVDRLLASPYFGEKWARHWLDLARYADSNGYQHDDLRTMWPYRDWVIRALNADMPFDQFTLEQLAGDLLPNATIDQRVATAFHRNTPTNFSGGSKVDEVRAALLMDRVNVTGQVWLATTMECAACHDHKFDPVTQKDYYELYAFFNQAVKEVDQEAADMFRKKFVGPTVEIPLSEQQQSRRDELAQERAAVEAELESLKPDVLADQQRWEDNFRKHNRAATYPRTRLDNKFGGAPFFVQRLRPDDRNPFQKSAVRHLLFVDHELTSGLIRRQREIDAELETLVAPVVHVLGDSESPQQTSIFERGNYLASGETVTPNGLGSFHSFDEGLPRNRLGLAQWLVDERNPLVARVTVNRWWAELFGRGIVGTLDDFGMQSAPPSHPELLDWLAVELVENGWSMKHILRTIVLSKTYRQSSVVTPTAATLDPENRLFSRAPRYRMSAELVRDNALAVSGLLSKTLYGPPVYPPQPGDLWAEIPGADVKNYPTSTGEDRYRRGIYVVLRRGNPHPSLLNFDAADRSLCVAKRPRTNTPLQALTLLNDPVFVEAADHFAKLIAERPGDVRAKARWAFRRAIAREPSDAELKTLLEVAAFDSTWFDVAQVLLNCDECICK